MIWISVEDHLPSNKVEVLGVNQFNEFAVIYRDRPWASESAQWWKGLTGSFEPTYWMELPEMPLR